MESLGRERKKRNEKRKTMCDDENTWDPVRGVSKANACAAFVSAAAARK